MGLLTSHCIYRMKKDEDYPQNTQDGLLGEGRGQRGSGCAG